MGLIKMTIFLSPELVSLQLMSSLREIPGLLAFIGEFISGNCLFHQWLEKVSSFDLVDRLVKLGSSDLAQRRTLQSRRSVLDSRLSSGDFTSVFAAFSSTVVARNFMRAEFVRKHQKLLGPKRKTITDLSC